MNSEFHTPEWVHNAIFYQIFPDRFASSPEVFKPGNLEAWDTPPTPNGFKGGDLLGVKDHLDYLQDLGIDAIYFTPVFQSASNHRYHTHDYYKVDPLLGGDAALRSLVDEAHRRGIKIVLDGVFNHASRGFFPFNHILECGAASPYLDWFDVKGYPLNAYWGKPNYRCWVGLAALPEFNHKNPQVVRYIYDVARYWIEEFDIDGWRLDVPFEFGDDAFWHGFRQVVKQANPQAYITGEIPEDGSRWLQGDQFDGVMNYLASYCAWGFFGAEELDHDMVAHWDRHAGPLLSPDAADFARNVQALLEKYPRPAVLAQLNILDSHDTARLLTLFRGDVARLKLATLFQMTYPGAPCVYYGDEIGMAGGKDPDCRRSFPWDERRWDLDLRAYFKTLIETRKRHPCLRTGSYEVLHAADGVVAALRQAPGDQALVVFNRTPSTLHLDLDLQIKLPDGLLLRDALSSQQSAVAQGRLSGITLPPMSGALLV